MIKMFNEEKQKNDRIKLKKPLHDVT
jgi:hypothetical protein